MPYPSGSLATQRPDLGTLYETDLVNNKAGFVRNKVIPIIETQVQSGTFGRIPSEQLAKVNNVNRTSSGGYNRINFAFDDDSFQTKEYGLEGLVDRRNANIYANYLNAEMATTRIVTNNVLTQSEIRTAALLFNTTTFTGASLFTSVGIEWDTIATAVPINNVVTAGNVMRANCGMYPNALLISRKVWRNLIRCAQIIDAIEATGAGDRAKMGDVTTEMVANCMDLSYVIVGDGVYDSAKEGQTSVFTDIWDDEYALLCRVAETNSIEEPCIGRTFHWNGDGSMADGAVETYYSEEVRGDVVRVRHEVQEKILYTECGHLLGNITT